MEENKQKRKTLKEHTHDILHEVMVVVKNKITIALTAISLIVIGVATDYVNAKLSLFVGKEVNIVEEQPKPHRVELGKPEISFTNSSTSNDGRTDVRTLFEDQYDLQDANWGKLFNHYNALKIRLEDGWWTKQIVLPVNAPIGCEFQVQRYSMWESTILMNGKIIPLHKKVVYRFIKTDDGWTQLD